MDGIVEYLKSKGVTQFLIVVDDPDSDKYVVHRDGSALWAIGAGHYAAEQVTQHQLELPSE